MTETYAERHLRNFAHAKWRIARQQHHCDSYFHLACIGTGFIEAGQRYFDTGDAREFTRGPIMHKACEACASAKAAEGEE